MSRIKTFFQKINDVEKRSKLVSRASMCVLFLMTWNLRNNYVKLSKENAKNEQEIIFLKRNAISFNRSFEYFPVEFWQKKKEGKYFVLQYLNLKYVNTFGHIFDFNRYNIIGKNNFQLGYPNNIAQRFYENDIAVSITGKPLYSTESFVDSIGVLRKIKVIKWREFEGKDTLVNGMVLEFLKR